MYKTKRTSRSTACYFHTNESEPHYRDVDVLVKFISERKKILPAIYTGICAKHQRQLSNAIKQARHLALLPFANQV